MLETKMLDALNDQINKEFYSSYLYLSMASFFNDNNLPGFSSWMEVQAKEEANHAFRFYKFIQDRSASVSFDAIAKPTSEWKSPLHVFEATLKHEIFISKSINNLVSIARDIKDYATDSFLHWFVQEQVEEEATADEILQKLKMVADSSQALLLMDNEMGKRVLPAATA